MAQLLKIGETIPSFEAKDFEGEIISQKDLLGTPFVIYFYPKDDTPGCTQEACEFRDLMESFQELDVLVVGISPDSPESHQKFMSKHNLNFPLISDERHELAKKFGVIKTKEGGGIGIIRSTFLCDQDGVVYWMEAPVKVAGHVERVLQAIEKTLG